MRGLSMRSLMLWSLVFCLSFPIAASADEGGWIVLIGERQGLDVWKAPTDKWLVAGDAALNPDNPKRLVAKPGKGVLVNGANGQAHDLLSKQHFGDIEVQ